MTKEHNIVDFPVPVEEEREAALLAEKLPREDLANLNDHKLTVALALGGGAARGWAHIGVLRAIDEAGINVSMIAGTSIGALVGGCYLAGKLDELEEFARSITRWNILRYMDFAVRASGLISGRRLADRMDAEIGNLNIEDLDRRFIAIATDINTGSEIWLEHGSLSQAIRASYALPGVFHPVQHFGRQMVDGAIVNPVPVSACRAFEAPIVIAVNLNSEIFGRSSVVRSPTLSSRIENRIPEDDDPEAGSWIPFLTGQTKPDESRLGMAGVMIEAFNIIQDRISRSRLAGDPPDYTIRPRLTDIGMSDFHKAEEAIALGYEVARVKLATLKEHLRERSSH